MQIFVLEDFCGLSVVGVGAEYGAAGSLAGSLGRSTVPQLEQIFVISSVTGLPHLGQNFAISYPLSNK